MAKEPEPLYPVFTRNPSDGTVSCPFPVDLPADDRYIIQLGKTCGALGLLLILWCVTDISSRWIFGVLGVLLIPFSTVILFESRRKMMLRLDETGFRIVGTRHDKPLVQWNEVEKFRMVNIRGSRFIAYQFKEGTSHTRQPGGVTLDINQFANLPVDTVCALMEECRREFGTPEKLPGEPDSKTI